MLRTVIALLLLSVPAVALSAEKEFDKVKLCEAAGDMAEVIMDARLSGVPMQKLMKRVNEDPANGEMVSLMVVKAYESPMYQTEEHKTRAKVEFKNKWYLDCYKAVSKAK